MRKLFQWSFFVFVALFGLSAAFSPVRADSGLSLSKTAPRTIKSDSDTIQYTLTCFNAGSDAARGVIIEDTLPAGTEFIAGSATSGGRFSGNRVTFKLGALDAGDAVTVSYRVRPFDGLFTGNKIQSGEATLTSANMGSATSNAVMTSLMPANLRVAAATGGKIVFITNLNGDVTFQVYIMNSDGSGITRLTNDGLYHYSPILSPDGSKVAFIEQDSDGNDHLFVMKTEPQSATNQPIQLTNDDGVNTGSGDYPCWSPNGRQIVYGAGGTPFVTDLTPQSKSHQPIRLTDSTGGQQFSVSPDGTKLAGSYFGTSFVHTIAVSTLTLDSSGNITGVSGTPNSISGGTLDAYSPTWSADGSEIAYVANTPNSSNGDLYKVTVANRSVTRLTTNQQVSFRNASWSPDGSLIAFESRGPGQTPDGTITPGGIEGIYTIKPVPATAQGGTNYPVYLTSQTFISANDPSFAQVKGSSTPASPLALTKSLLSVNGQAGNARLPVAPGDDLAYLIKVANTGNSTQSNIVVTDPVPDHTTGVEASFADASGKPANHPSGYTLTFNGTPPTAVLTLDRLDPGQSAYITVEVKVQDADNSTIIKNTATLKAGDTTLASTVNLLVNATPTLSLVKGVRFINGTTGVPNEVVSPGDILIYVLKYVNSGKGAATNAKITDTLPANTRTEGTFFSDADGNKMTPPPGGGVSLTSSEGTASFDIPRVAPKSVGYVTVAVIVKDDAASKATQIINVKYGLTADGGINLMNLPAVTNPLHAPIAISKKVTQVNSNVYRAGTKVKTGDVITYTITVTNPSGSGAATANNLTVTDFIPVGTTIKSAGSGTYKAAFPPYVQFSIPTLAVGASTTRVFTVTVGKGATDKVANVNYGVQIAGLNRRFTGTEVDVPFQSAAGLKATQNAVVIENGSTTKVAPGQSIRYVLTLTNTGGTTLTNVTMRDSAPNSSVLTQAFLGTVDHPVTGTAPTINGPTATFHFGTLAPGAKVQATLETQVKFGTTDNNIINNLLVATADGLNVQGDQTILSLTTGGPAAPRLTLSKVPTQDGETTTEVSPSDRLNYEFHYANSAGSNSSTTLAKDVTLTETLPTIQTASGNIKPKIASASQTYTLSSAGDVIWHIGDLSNGKSGIITIKLEIPDNATVGSKIVNSAYELDADNISGVGAKGATVTLPIVTPKIPKIGLVLGTTVDDSQPKTSDGKLLPGAVIQYQFIARNSGNGTALNVFLRDNIPTGTEYVEGSAGFDDTFPATIKTGDVQLTRSNGKVTVVQFEPGNMAPRAAFVAHFSVVVSATASTSLTSVSNYGVVDRTDKEGDPVFDFVKSNVDTRQISIPNPAPPKPVYFTFEHEFRPTVVARNTAFSTGLIITNFGGKAAHNIILRYNFDPSGEQVVSSSDGGQRIGATQEIRTILWDGTGSSQQAKFVTLNPGESIHVQLTLKSQTKKTQTLITGEVVDVHEKSTTNSHGAITNPVFHMNLPNIPVVDSLNLTASGSRSLQSVQAASASQPGFFDNLVKLFQSIGAKIGSALFGGNVSAPVRQKLSSLNLNTSKTTGSTDEDFAAMTCTLGQIVKVTPIIPGVYFRVSGPENLVHIVAQGGGNIVAQGGGNIVAQGGGNAINIDTLQGNETVSQFFAKVISNDGGTLKNTNLYFGGNNTLISGNNLIGQDGNGLRIPLPSLIGQDGNGLLAKGQLIGQDGNGLISQDGNGLISQDGNGLIGQDGNGLIGQDGNGLIGQDGNGLANIQGNGLVSTGHAGIVAQGGGNIVAQGGGN